MLCRSAFIICAVPRSGSSLLCNLLQLTGVAGNPMEYGGQDDERVWRQGHGFSHHRDYFLHFAHRMSVTSNGVFSAKLMFEQMIAFAADLKRYKSIDAGGPLATIDFAFGKPRYVQMLRRDKERQAISFVRAAQTGAWNWAQARAGAVAYDLALLERAQKFLHEKEMAWNDVLRDIDLSKRTTLYYEHLMTDMSGTVARLLAWLQIPDPPVSFKPPSIRQQSDALTEQWLEAWRSQRQLTK
jgi:LPS sulfotransferase NodH